MQVFKKHSLRGDRGSPLGAAFWGSEREAATHALSCRSITLCVEVVLKRQHFRFFEKKLKAKTNTAKGQRERRGNAKLAGQAGSLQAWSAGIAAVLGVGWLSSVCKCVLRSVRHHTCVSQLNSHAMAAARQILHKRAVLQVFLVQRHVWIIAPPFRRESQ